MIHLRDLLAEITLGSTSPYATQFVWSAKSYRGYKTKVQCEGIPVEFEMDRQYTADGEEYIFFMAMPSNTGGGYNRAGYTMYHRHSDVVGQLSYLRVLQTAGEAILDFCTQYVPDAIDVTGFDEDDEKDLQKTRIYRGLLHANAAKIAGAGYTILDHNGKLYLVRKSNADATGVNND